MTGVTATAVRQRLIRLHAEGFISRQTTRQDRGRPYHTYSLAPEGLKLLGDHHAEMAALLWREVMRISQPEIREQILAQVKQTLVERFGVRSKLESLPEKMEGICHTLAGFGFDIEYVPANERPGDEEHLLPILREYNCPYHEIAARNPSICEFEQSVFSEMLGASVELSACRLAGHRCCEFEVSQSVPGGTLR